MPLLADGNTNVLSPFNLLYAVLPPLWVYTIETFALFAILLWGTLAYLRDRGCSTAGCIAGVYVFAYSGQVVFWSLYHGGNLSISLMPWTLLAFRRTEVVGRLGRSGSVSTLFWGCAAFTMLLVVLLGGFIQFSVLVVIAAFVDGLADLSVAEWVRVARSRGASIALAALGAAGIAVPVAEAGRNSHRSFVAYYQGIIPHDTGSLAGPLLSGISRVGSSYPPYFYYLGAGALAAGVYAARTLDRSELIRPLVLFSLAFPLLGALVVWEVLPADFQFGVASDPFRGVFLFMFALGGLAGSAFARLHRQVVRGEAPSVLVEAVLAGATLLGLVGWLLPAVPTLQQRAFVPRLVAVGFVLIAGGLGVGHLRGLRTPVRSGVFNGFLLALCLLCSSLWGDYLQSGTDNQPDRSGVLARLPVLASVRPEELASRGASTIIDLLRGEGRVVYSGANQFFNDDATAFRVRALGGYGAFLPRELFLRARADGLLPGEFDALTHFSFSERLDPSLLALYGVRYLVRDAGPGLPGVLEAGWRPLGPEGLVSVFENPSYRGRAYVLRPSGAIRGAQIDVDLPGRVEVLVADAEAGETLILADSWFPGWTCYRGAQRLDGFNADGFRGVNVPESGPQRLAWVYEPRSVVLGGWLSCFGVVVFAAVTGVRLAARPRQVA